MACVVGDGDQDQNRKIMAKIKPRVKLGCEVFLSANALGLKDAKIGFVTNHTGLTSNLDSLIDKFLDKGLQIKALFGPEHGIRGEAAAGEKVSSGSDPKTGIKIYSLYGDTRRPTEEMLRGLDALIFDIQDVGARFYTFMWTMANCLEAAADHKVPFFVLDRPNPVGGMAVEGPVLDTAFKSFIGYYPVPIRHGFTVGEMARFVAEAYKKNPGNLSVVPMEGWKREMWFDETGLQWVMPSPGMPTLDTAVVYTCSCLFEGTNVSEGRGTTKPFEIFGAPWMDLDRVAAEANDMNLPGIRFRPLYFEPTFSKYKGERCGGAQIHTLDRDCFEPVKTGLSLVHKIMKLYPDDFAFREPGSTGKAFFDLLMGSDKPRQMLMKSANLSEIICEWESDLSRFFSNRGEYLLY